MATVELKNIEKQYDNGFVAVKDFNLDITDKEFIIFVGPSGCGKSTTLRMIAGLEDISKGELYIDGQLVNDLSPKDRDIAMVFQNYALYPHMSVYDNMAFSLKLKKVPKAEIDQKVKQAAAILGLEDLLKRKPKQLSGGQRQRVALGRAIVRNPKVFLMDEPLSNLDAKLRVQMRVEIVKLYNRLQTTFIYVTHDQTEAMTMGTRIVVMKDGLIQQVADPKTLYNRPANKFVAGFIGTPPMNFINAALKLDEGVLLAGLQDETGEIKSYLRLNQDVLEDVKDFIDKPVILGIRPEDIYESHAVSEQFIDRTVAAKVEVVEMLGAETYLHVKTQVSDAITARVDSQKTIAKAGDEIKIGVDATRINIFDAETEKTISNGVYKEN